MDLKLAMGAHALEVVVVWKCLIYEFVPSVNDFEIISLIVLAFHFQTQTCFIL